MGSAPFSLEQLLGTQFSLGLPCAPADPSTCPTAMWPLGVRTNPLQMSWAVLQSDCYQDTGAEGTSSSPVLGGILEALLAALSQLPWMWSPGWEESWGAGMSSPSVGMAQGHPVVLML